MQPEEPGPALVEAEAEDLGDLTESLNGIATIFAHPYITVFRLTQLPNGYPEAYPELPAHANTAEFEDRGWTYAESLWASWPTKQTLDLGRLIDCTDLPRDRRSLLRLCGDKTLRQLPPRLPSKFESTLETKQWLNSKDDKPLVAKLYAAAFRTFFETKLKLDYSRLGWGDDEVRELCEVIRSGTLRRCQIIDLSSNRVGDHGMRDLAAAIESGKLSSCKAIVLDGCPGNPSAVYAALATQVKRATDAALLKKWAHLGEHANPQQRQLSRRNSPNRTLSTSPTLNGSTSPQAVGAAARAAKT